MQEYVSQVKSQLNSIDSLLRQILSNSNTPPAPPSHCPLDQFFTADPSRLMNPANPDPPPASPATNPNTRRNASPQKSNG